MCSAAPEATFCSACICGLKNTILDGLTAKGIKVAPADQTNLINNCMGALATPLSDPKVGNLADEVGKLIACNDPAAIAAKCPAAPAATTKPAAKTAATAGTSPVPAVEAVALPSPAVAAVPAASPAAAVPAASPPPKSAAGAVVASMGAVAAVALLQAMLY
jgi:hypothetical protein